MPPRKAAKAAAGGIDALPDEVLHHLLSFLGAQDAVRTCVLARRWRHLWRSATGLRIGGGVGEMREFVDNLLLLRGRAPLDRCEFCLDDSDDSDDDTGRVNLWIRQAILCEVKVLRLQGMRCEGLPLSSQHLTRLHLYGVLLSDDYLNFSSCMALQTLDIISCSILCAKILSQSVKYLSVTMGCFSFSFRTHVFAPSLITLRVVDYWFMTPVLEAMPSLVDASIRVGRQTSDCCDYSEYGDCGHEDCVSCYGSIHDNNEMLLLHGISEAKNLTLIAEPNTGPTFTKLKTLLLNEHWCVAPYFTALAYIFQHAPVLEKLTLELFTKGHKHELEMKGRYFAMEKSAAISKHFKIVEVRCNMVDGDVLKVLKFLCTFNICKTTANPFHFWFNISKIYFVPANPTKKAHMLGVRSTNLGVK
ncbi:hypothetical protein BS78_05G104600 [Paspalum vaginatum]|nr:hypothetical protein BS78_05G104600 [Paspalum vaginatum]